MEKNKLKTREIEKIMGLFKWALENAGWKKLEQDLILKREKWFEENKKSLSLKGNDLEKALQLFLLKAEVDPLEVLIIKKTKRKIIFHSKNFCPVLENCKILGLDTRKVCKLVFEKPTQKLIEKINPKLKFSRNYKKIRPYADYCEEIIELI